MARAEGAFLEVEFLAPAVGGRGVGVRIAGVRCALKVRPASFHGWGVFRPTSHDSAMLVRNASAGERQRYLSLFPAARLVVCSRQRAGVVTGVMADATAARIGADGQVELLLADEVEPFDTAVARFDGTQFWFDRPDARADPAAAAHLRRALSEMTEPAKVDRPSLTAAHRRAYAVAYVARATALAADARRLGELRLQSALAHAGATLRDYADAGDSYRVTFLVDGRRHTSVIRKGDLSVRSAGICLSGQDANFDLGSLVGVLREGEASGQIVRW